MAGERQPGWDEGPGLPQGPQRCVVLRVRLSAAAGTVNLIFLWE